MTAAATWHTEPTDHAALLLTGPGIDDLVHTIAEDLADSLYQQDARGDAWTAFVEARFALAVAKEHGTEDIGLDVLEDNVAAAWDRLVPELAASVRLHLAEARLVGGKLDELAGRIGMVAA